MSGQARQERYLEGVSPSNNGNGNRIFESVPSSNYMAIIPIGGASSVLPSIMHYFDSLKPDIIQRVIAAEESFLPNQVFSLLRHMTVSAPHELISEHDANIISDLFPSFQALSAAVRTVEGRQLLEDYLGATSARIVIDFWEKEWVCA